MILSTSCEISPIWKLKKSLDDMSTLILHWLGAGRQQTITWANVNPDFCSHMVSLGHSELKPLFLGSAPKLTYVCNSIQLTVTYPSFTHSSGANCSNITIFWKWILDITFIIRLLETICDMLFSIISYLWLTFTYTLFVEVTKWGDNIGSDNGLAPSRRQAIIWISGG